MEESVTYQAIIQKGVVRGRLEEARKTLLLQGGKRFGPAEVTVKTAIESIQDLDHLEDLSLRLLDVESWQELLA